MFAVSDKQDSGASSPVKWPSLRIDKGSPGDAAHLGTCFHNYGSWISILFVL